MSFKIGDRVRIFGQQDSIVFNGEEGIIVRSDPNVAYRWGIDFANTGFSHGSLHRLSSGLPNPTGYWVRESFLKTLEKRKKTGFSKFINQIETTTNNV